MASDERDPVMEAVGRVADVLACYCEETYRCEWCQKMETITAELNRLRDLNAKLVQEAQIHAGEARAANASLYECYQAVSGATGEKGNWHGSRPVVEELTRLRAQVAERDADLAALVPLARYGCDMVNWKQGEGWLVAEKDAARAALARVEARNG
jgi:hypothetical protein